MNEEIMRKAGFDKEVDRVKEGKCSLCGKEIDTVFEFRDGVSKREFSISGLCQECQDKTFGATRADYWKGCCLKSSWSWKEHLVEHIKKYSSQFATFIEDRNEKVVIEVAGKRIEMSKAEFVRDWRID